MLILLKIFSVIRNVTSYIIDLAVRYPLQIILILLTIYSICQKLYIDNIKNEYAGYKATIAYQAKIAAVKNEILRKQAIESVKEAELIYENNLKVIKNEYLKKQKLDSVTIVDLRSKLRDTIKSNTFTMPQVEQNTKWTAEEWGNHYAALVGKYDTLVMACSVTTNDYNLLRDWANISCNQVGCE